MLGLIVFDFVEQNLVEELLVVECLVENLEEHFDIAHVEENVGVEHTCGEEYILAVEQTEVVEVVYTVVAECMEQNWGSERDLLSLGLGFDFGLKVVRFDDWFRILNFVHADFS